MAVDSATGEVVERLAGRKEWNPRTVKTLLNRLVKKGALGFEAEGKRYLYRALVKREECVRRENESFVSRVFGGRAGEMLCRFVDEEPHLAEPHERSWSTRSTRRFE